MRGRGCAFGEFRFGFRTSGELWIDGVFCKQPTPAEGECNRIDVKPLLHPI